jgi:hypothetical protein
MGKGSGQSKLLISKILSFFWDNYGSHLEVRNQLLSSDTDIMVKDELNHKLRRMECQHLSANVRMIRCTNRIHRHRKAGKNLLNGLMTKVSPEQRGVSNCFIENVSGVKEGMFPVLGQIQEGLKCIGCDRVGKGSQK